MRPRRLIALRGERAATALAAREALAGRAEPAPEDLWIGPDDTPPRAVAGLLGQAFDAVVLDLHDGLDADVLAQAHGFVRGGGALLLRLPSPGAPPAPARARLAAFPYTAGDVGDRFHRVVERALARATLSAPTELGPATRAFAGTPEQTTVAARLTARLAGEAPTLTTLVADRGRGKSSALGLALSAALDDGLARVAVTAQSPAAAAEVFRFACGTPAPPTAGPVRWVAPMALATDDVGPFDAILVDEAAQLPVPVLERVVARHPSARLAFATTTRGYEGSGRGFTLRFLAWLARADPRPLEHLTLTTPIRWPPDDPVERFVFDALLLDALPAEAADVGPDEVEHVAFDRDALVADERALREVFGLLVHAHYRTVPEDLHRLLDAPNLALHGLRSRRDGGVVAVSLVAREGGLPPELCAELARGRRRVRAHALPDALVAHLGVEDAGALPMIRSVRLAVHPEARRRGLATTLVDAIHAAYPEAELFGTLFGATPELLAFRRTVGYEVARVGASRGARTGEPAVMMLRPVSARARTLVTAVRAELARDLPLQLELLAADGELLLDPRLAEALARGLPAPAPLDDAARDALIASYLDGPRTFEARAAAVTALAAAHPAALRALDPQQRALIEARVLARRGWVAAARAAGYASVGAAMRALRPAVAALRRAAASNPE